MTRKPASREEARRQARASVRMEGGCTSPEAEAIEDRAAAGEINDDEALEQILALVRRRRVSGPGLRTFLAIADHYDIPERDRIALLGDPSSATYREWERKARSDAKLTLPMDTLNRISGVLGIHKALRLLFPVDAEAMTWLMGPHHAEVFGGQAPIEVAVDGGLHGILTVRRYLEALEA